MGEILSCENRRKDFGKYLVICLFLVFLISLVSGFLVADNNFHIAYEEGFEKFLGTVCTNCHSNHEDKELAKLIRDKIGNKVFEFNDEVYGRVELNES